MFRLSDKTAQNLSVIFNPFLLYGKGHEKLDTKCMIFYRCKFFVGFCRTLFGVLDSAALKNLPSKQADDRTFIGEAFSHGSDSREKCVVQIGIRSLFEDFAQHRRSVNRVVFCCKSLNVTPAVNDRASDHGEARDCQGKSVCVCHVRIIVIFSPDLSVICDCLLLSLETGRFDGALDGLINPAHVMASHFRVVNEI
jgi:hypothetical protein